ncbi:anaerobic ribonucleoside-triphosphate reductase activating protein [Spiroplasma gladiatoris]|uniref:Anaerobic ribonucleoside-triphosphate reductase activating protein n=1 Tax=Spiroplasma gladiatoris TaxID=2143 RepID=A0A4P7AGV7_9MOLU|nr:4Fe-4S single cluster domain-containing protein [Spiroplasma gladiatoris]QBQ07377.1 anaerobic ribonucleoside-triphosphate reductase activating protein [Spiroplasma gladiatoris]
MANINIAKILMVSEIEGPGKRFVVWFQGCNIGCKGCCNKELLELKPKIFIPIEILLEKILEAKIDFNIEGITILGGEPFLQPDALKELVEFCAKNSLTIVCFTGYIYEKLLEEYDSILKYIDILIDGPFIMSQLDIKRRLIGSKNQRVIKITKNYKDCDYFEKPYSQVEIQLYKSRVSINGDGVVFDNEKGEFIFKLK